jgi:hypothetical protein
MVDKDAENYTNGTYGSKSKYYKHKLKKKHILPTEKLLICEIVFFAE